jgi:hypothetical protein
VRLAPSARQDLRDLLAGWKKAGGDAEALSTRLLNTADTLQRRPGIGHTLPDVTGLPLYFFPTIDEIMIVYQPEPFRILFFIPPWVELAGTLRRRLAQAQRRD